VCCARTLLISVARANVAHFVIASPSNFPHDEGGLFLSGINVFRRRSSSALGQFFILL